MTWFIAILRFAILSALLATLISANCECGYLMRDSNEYFTHLIYNNFSRSPNVEEEFFQNWDIQTWTVGPGVRKSQFPLLHEEGNIGIQGGALILRQKGYSKEDRRLHRNVSVAAIASQRRDILHGSFRAVMKVEGAKGGSVGGFFWYHNDTNEIDIEFLTKKPSPDNTPIIHYTAQPSIDEEENLIPDATEAVQLLSHKHRQPNSFLTHRFDWSGKELRFYQNSQMIHKHSVNIPTVAGSANINIWADGGDWSGIPSTSDVTMSVRSVVIYHNTTTSDTGHDKAFNRQCRDAGGISRKTLCRDHEIESGEMDPSIAAARPVEPPLYALRPFFGCTFFLLAWIL